MSAPRRALKTTCGPGNLRAMQDAAMSWARDLDPPVKSAIANLLGRPLQDDEQVSVRVSVAIVNVKSKVTLPRSLIRR